MQMWLYLSLSLSLVVYCTGPRCAGRVLRQRAQRTPSARWQSTYNVLVGLESACSEEPQGCTLAAAPPTVMPARPTFACISS